MSAEQIARYEDAKAGRVLNFWRYYGVAWLIVAAFIAGRTLPDGYWWSVGAMAVALILHGVLLSKYKQRSLH